MKIKFLKKHNHKRFTFEVNQVVDIRRQVAKQLIIDKIAVPYVQETKVAAVKK